MDHHGEDFVNREGRLMIPNVHQPSNNPQTIYVDENIVYFHAPVERESCFQLIKCFCIIAFTDAIICFFNE